MKTRKVYAWTLKQNNVSLVLTGKTGCRVRYDFSGGSIIQQIPATFVTENEYYQKLLEDSDLFQRGTVRIKQVIPILDKEEAEKKEKEAKSEVATNLTPVNGIRTAKSAMDWVANQFGEKTTSGLRAIEAAKKHGYYFPDYNP